MLDTRVSFLLEDVNRYASIDLAPIKTLRKIEAEIDSYFGGRWHKNRIWTG